MLILSFGEEEDVVHLAFAPRKLGGDGHVSIRERVGEDLDRLFLLLLVEAGEFSHDCGRFGDSCVDHVLAHLVLVLEPRVWLGLCDLSCVALVEASLELLHVAVDGEAACLAGFDEFFAGGHF